LEIVRSKTSRICPLICEAGFRAEGERCVALAPAPPPAAGPVRRAIRDRVQQRLAPEAAAPSPGGGRVSCGKFGCIAVKPGCRVVPGPDLQEAVACN
jgi:hypothetical protein